MPFFFFAGIFGAVFLCIYAAFLQRRTNPVSEAVNGFQNKQAEKGEEARGLEEHLKELWRTDDDLLAVGIASALAGLVLGLFASGLKCGPVAAILAFIFVPRLWAMILKLRRRQAFLAQLPRAANAMATVLRSNGPVLSAIGYAAEVTSSPVKEEFEELKENIDANTPIEEALKRLAQKIDLPEMWMLADALEIAAEIGGGSAAVDVLEGAVEFTRERVRLRQKIQSVSADIRFGFKIITLFPPGMALLLAVAIPYYRLILFSARGRLLAAVAAGFLVLGHLWVRLMLRSGEKEMGL